MPAPEVDPAALTDVLHHHEIRRSFGPVVASGREFIDLYSAAVSRVCVICAKKPGFGHNRSHSMVATKRRFNPNLQQIRIMLDGSPTRAYVCTRCLKSGRVQKAV